MILFFPVFAYAHFCFDFLLCPTALSLFVALYQAMGSETLILKWEVKGGVSLQPFKGGHYTPVQYYSAELTRLFKS